MKNYALILAVLLMGSVLLTACDSNNGEQHGIYPVAVSNGAYTVCSGNSSKGIDGALTYYDYNTKNSSLDIFKSNNGINLGQTPNDAMRYGEKFYIVVSGEHKVFVTDPKTMKILHTIDMTALLGETEGANPRRLTADQSNIYVSTYGGYVAAIDTITFSLKQKYKAGSYPEGIAVSNGYLFVANSDYGGGNASISRIDLTTGTDIPLVNENIRNPQDIAVAGSNIYYLDYGEYGPAPDYTQQHAGVYLVSGNNVSMLIPDATMMSAAGYTIYTINAPYGAGSVTYSVYNLQSGTLFALTPDGIESPAAIGVDPISGDVMIASYKLNGGYADYAANGYVNVYDRLLTEKKATFECGVGPQRIVYNVGVEYVKY